MNSTTDTAATRKVASKPDLEVARVLIDGEPCWSASDLTAASSGEYVLLRRLDHQLGRAEKAEVKSDPLMDHIARWGDSHEARLLTELETERTVVELDDIAAGYSAIALASARVATLAA